MKIKNVLLLKLIFISLTTSLTGSDKSDIKVAPPLGAMNDGIRFTYGLNINDEVNFEEGGRSWIVTSIKDDIETIENKGTIENKIIKREVILRPFKESKFSNEHIDLIAEGDPNQVEPTKGKPFKKRYSINTIYEPKSKSTWRSYLFYGAIGTLLGAGVFFTATLGVDYFNYLVQKATSPWLSPLKAKFQEQLEKFGFSQSK